MNKKIKKLNFFFFGDVMKCYIHNLMQKSEALYIHEDAHLLCLLFPWHWLNWSILWICWSFHSWYLSLMMMILGRESNFRWNIPAPYRMIYRRIRVGSRHNLPMLNIEIVASCAALQQFKHTIYFNSFNSEFTIHSSVGPELVKYKKLEQTCLQFWREGITNKN